MIFWLSGAMNYFSELNTILQNIARRTSCCCSRMALSSRVGWASPTPLLGSATPRVRSAGGLADLAKMLRALHDAFARVASYTTRKMTLVVPGSRVSCVCTPTRLAPPPRSRRLPARRPRGGRGAHGPGAGRRCTSLAARPSRLC